MLLSRLRNVLFAVSLSLQRNAGELLLAIGLAMIAAALWPALGRLALLPIGVCLVWIALPARTSFVERPPLSPEKKRRAT